MQQYHVLNCFTLWIFLRVLFQVNEEGIKGTRCHFFFLYFPSTCAKKTNAILSFGKKIMTERFQVGYVTLTGDTPHQGHFAYVAACKKLCHILIVGLTTDEVAEKQKRQVVMEYAHRKAVFENCKWVDIVVPHFGEPKFEAWQRLRFNVCFTSSQKNIFNRKNLISFDNNVL